MRLWILVLVFALAGALPEASAQVLPVQYAQEQGAASASEAASIAQSRHGGEVLKVERAGKYYKVRLLSPDGRVKEVKVPAKQ